MEHIRVNDNIRMETVKVSMAPVIFRTIDNDRDFLKQWLPFIEFTQKLSDTESFLKTVERQKGRKKDEIFSIWYKEEFAGLIGFKETDWINHKSEIGYWITSKMQGKGTVTLCTNELLKYAFNKLNLNRIQVRVAVGNHKSAAIPKRLGFQAEGIERQGELHNNTFLDLQVFSILKTDLINPKLPYKNPKKMEG